jgi:hypothetical protein
VITHESVDERSVEMRRSARAALLGLLLGLVMIMLAGRSTEAARKRELVK